MICYSFFRVVAPGKTTSVAGYTFKNFGAHYNSYPHAYLTAAAGIGITREDVDIFITRLDKVLVSYSRLVQKQFPKKPDAGLPNESSRAPASSNLRAEDQKPAQESIGRGSESGNQRYEQLDGGPSVTSGHESVRESVLQGQRSSHDQGCEQSVRDPLSNDSASPSHSHRSSSRERRGSSHERESILSDYEPSRYERRPSSCERESVISDHEPSSHERRKSLPEHESIPSDHGSVTRDGKPSSYKLESIPRDHEPITREGRQGSPERKSAPSDRERIGRDRRPGLPGHESISGGHESIARDRRPSSYERRPSSRERESVPPDQKSIPRNRRRNSHDQEQIPRDQDPVSPDQRLQRQNHKMFPIDQGPKVRLQREVGVVVYNTASNLPGSTVRIREPVTGTRDQIARNRQPVHRHKPETAMVKMDVADDDDEDTLAIDDSDFELPLDVTAPDNLSLVHHRKY